MKQIILAYTVLSLLLLAGSCTEPITIRLDESYSRLVVEGSVTSERKRHTVALSRTSDYFFNQPPERISGARVTITEGVNRFELEETTPGNYVSILSFRGIAGQTYTLDVELDEQVGGYSEYTASSKLYPVSPVDTITLVYHPDWGSKGVWEVQCFVLDPPTEEYYRFMISRNDILVTDTLSEWFVIDDKFFNGNYVAGASIGFLSQDSPDERLVPGDVVTAEINSIGKEYANFIQEAQSELFGSNPLFSGPPANVKGNISNGAFGFFATYSITRGYALVPAIPN